MTKNNDENEKKDLVKQEGTKPLPPEKSIKLGKSGELDLTGLTEEQIKELKQKHAEGMIDVGRMAAELGVATRALDEKLGTMAGHTIDIAKEGSDVTITSTSTDSIGRTEIIMGTSDAAKKGKLTLSQTGQGGIPIAWIAIGIFVIVIVAIVALMK